MMHADCPFSIRYILFVQRAYSNERRRGAPFRQAPAIVNVRNLTSQAG
jgi:hypothetical protein